MEAGKYTLDCNSCPKERCRWCRRAAAATGVSSGAASSISSSEPATVGSLQSCGPSIPYLQLPSPSLSYGSLLDLKAYMRLCPACLLQCRIWLHAIKHRTWSRPSVPEPTVEALMHSKQQQQPNPGDQRRQRYALSELPSPLSASAPSSLSSPSSSSPASGPSQPRSSSRNTDVSSACRRAGWNGRRCLCKDGQMHGVSA